MFDELHWAVPASACEHTLILGSLDRLTRTALQKLDAGEGQEGVRVRDSYGLLHASRRLAYWKSDLAVGT